MPAQESGEPESPEQTVISVQTGVYTGMLIVAAVCMALAVAFTYFSQRYYTLEGGKLVEPVHPKAGEPGYKSVSPAPALGETPAKTEEKATEEAKPAEEEKKEEAAPAEEKKEEAKPAEEEKKEEAKPAEEEKKEEAKPAEEKKEEAKPAEEKKEE